MLSTTVSASPLIAPGSRGVGCCVSYELREVLGLARAEAIQAFLSYSVDELVLDLSENDETLNRSSSTTANVYVF